MILRHLSFYQPVSTRVSVFVEFQTTEQEKYFLSKIFDALNQTLPFVEHFVFVRALRGRIKQITRTYFTFPYQPSIHNGNSRQ
ncbi:hypothetical protein Enr17x_24830 [Gimesia fumaroli]|uniref:Uncharacterized protein n=1 Tax=Gimesia fumaroli TaxID=2527976 RepID=A0A518IBF5_9PLAN|nr:hypothetical protein Enr17x_24830 [Gimesia fumaroli]